jgi:hypothetical protein
MLQISERKEKENIGLYWGVHWEIYWEVYLFLLGYKKLLKLNYLE